MKKTKSTILIADDHPIVLEGLSRLIEKDIINCKLIKAHSGTEVLAFARKENFDLFILDMGMPGVNGLDVLKSLRSMKVQTPVLFLSMYSEDQYALRAIKQGAWGYLTKSSAPEELIRAINCILRGKKYITPTVGELIATAYESNSTQEDLHLSLSDRELEVLKLIASGKTITEISELITLSAGTVSTYRKRLMEKMNMKTNSELTYYAIKTGLVL